MSTDVLSVPNIGTRVFRRPKLTIRNEKTGEIVPPEMVARSLVVIAVLEHAVADGARPKTILCADCKAVVRVSPNGGPVPERCNACRGAVCRDCGKPSAQGRRVEVCGECVAKRAAARRTCACGEEKDPRAAACASCSSAKRKHVAKSCVDCGAEVTSKAARCRSCGCKAREARKSPEARAKAAERARKQLTSEQRRALSALGVAARKRKASA